MNVSLSWLSQHLDLEGLSVSEISDMLTFAGIEVEGIKEQGVTSDRVVVAQVMQAVPHPDSDHLKVTQVDVGDGTLHQIVCGAQNYSVGDKVPCALPGSVLPGNISINMGKLRGVESGGMLCSASELGMVDKVNGLMILPPETVVGTLIRDMFDSDVIIEVEITPNRPDLLSHWGMAVELAAITGRQLKSDPVEKLVVPSPSTDQVVLETENCTYYQATKVKGVKVQDSPEWLQKRLLSVGLRPINNIVDITNYVLMELGNPLHVFDAAKVTTPLVVRQAQSGEKILALDGKEYTLEDEDTVVSDASGQALAIAGVMGGEKSGVTETTQDVILEAAWFKPSAVRRTSRRLGLSSDSSYRFERGTTHYGVDRACALAIKLLQEVGGGSVEKTVVAGESDVPEIIVDLPLSTIDQMCDGAVPYTDAKGILTRLGLKEISDNQWKMPAWRLDLTRPADLMEEIVRVYGLDKIPARYQGVFTEPSSTDKSYDFQMKLRRQLAGMGFYEAQTIKLIAESSLEGTIAQSTDALTIKPMFNGDLIKVALPLSEDHSVLRPSLIPGLMAVAVRNVRRGASSIRLFEMGRVFRNAGGGKAKDIESDSLGILMTGRLTEMSWSAQKSEMMAAEDMLAVLQRLLPNKVIKLVPNTKRMKEGFAQIADIQVNNKTIGAFARVALSRCRELDLPSGVYVAELELKKLQELGTGMIKASELPQFPGSSRDAALDVPATTSNALIEKSLESLKQPLLVEFVCFDVFNDSTGEKLAADRKSMAYTFLYRSLQKTLKSEEVDAAHQVVLNHLSKTIPGLTFRC